MNATDADVTAEPRPDRPRGEEFGGGPASGKDGGTTRGTLRTRARERFARTARASDAFFAKEADAVSRTCWAMARRFHRGGRLLAFGRGPCESDAYHVSVEFVHPVLVGKRALPALCLERPFAGAIEGLARAQDIALGITSRGEDPEVLEGLARARARELLTVGLAGGDGGRMGREEGLDHRFVVPDDDPTVVQEVQETLYHVLWELVHVFFDHTALLEAEEEVGS